MIVCAVWKVNKLIPLQKMTWILYAIYLCNGWMLTIYGWLVVLYWYFGFLIKNNRTLQPQCKWNIV